MCTCLASTEHHVDDKLFFISAQIEKDIVELSSFAMTTSAQMSLQEDKDGQYEPLPIKLFGPPASSR